MPKEKIDVNGGKTYGPYSPGIKSNGMIWLAGQIAPEAGDDIKLQTRACLNKIDEYKRDFYDETDLINEYD